MRNKRLFIVLAFAVIFGLVAAVSVGRFLASAKGNANGRRVVLAKVDIPVGTRLIAEQLTTAHYPPGATPAGAFDAPDKLVGRVVVTSLAANEVLTDMKLAPEGSSGGLSAIIPEGYRAMTVKVDDVVGLAGFVVSGALVDVVVVIDPPDNSSNKDPISKIVLQNIKVLASGQSLDRPRNERDPERVNTVTLQVTPDQAEKLALASTEGKVRLMMRNAVDQGDEQTPGANKRTLLTGERALPVPDPGMLKSERPKPAAPVARAARPRVTAPAETTKAAPAPRHTAIDVFEGAKKRTIDFP
jgi:pilus assembly protein CpaB